MIKLKEEDEKFIRENMKNANEVLASDDLNDILDELAVWIDMNGLGDDYFPNVKGREAQKVYDSIYSM